MKVKRQAGFLSIEAMVVLFVAMAGMTLGFQWLQADSDVKINRATAEHAITFTDATVKWMKDNSAAINAAANPFVQYTAGAVASYLPSTFTATNPYGQSYSIRVYKAAANQLQTMIVTTGGETIGEQSIRKIAQLIGAKGGFVSSANTTKAQGSYGGWNMSFSHFGSSPGAGKLAMALFFQDGALVSDYLYRNAVAGHPELNQMNTAINMNSNSINNAGQVNANTVSATSNVTVSGHLTAGNATINGHTQMNSAGVANNLWANSLGGSTASIGGQLTAGTAGVTNSLWAGSVGSNSIRSNGRLATGEFLYLDGHANEGWGCNPNGLVSRNGSGALLSCQEGEWRLVGQKVSVNHGVCQWIEAPSAYRNVRGYKTAVCPANFVMTGTRWYQISAYVDDEHVDAYCCPLG